MADEPTPPVRGQRSAQKLSAGQKKEVEELLRKQSESLSEPQLKTVKGILWKQFAGGLTLLALLFGFRLWSISGDVKSFVKEQFALPEVEKTFQVVVQTEATNMMLKQIQPAVDRFRTNVDTKFTEIMAASSKATKRQDEIIKELDTATKAALISIEVLKTNIAGQENLLRTQALFSKDLLRTLDERKIEADKLIAELTGQIKDAKKSTERLSESVDFTELIQRAQNDDRDAFDALRKMDKPAARSAYETIIRQRYTALPTNQSIPWADGVKPEDLELPRLQKIYDATALPTQIGLIQFISKNSKLTKYEKAAFLMNVISRDKHITAVEYAGRELRTTTGIKAPLDIDAFQTWWVKNEDALKAEIAQPTPK